MAILRAGQVFSPIGYLWIHFRDLVSFFLRFLNKLQDIEAHLVKSSDVHVEESVGVRVDEFFQFILYLPV